MKKKSKVILYALPLLLLLIFILNIEKINNAIGWYGYGYWKYRISTSIVQESKKRGVFVKNLNYKIIDSTNLKDFYFSPYIEKGFKVGKNNENETHILTNSNFPYNLCYERGLKDSVAIYILEDDINKIDSTNEVWGYLKQPFLKDTIRLRINSKNHKGIIKIW